MSTTKSRKAVKGILKCKTVDESLHTKYSGSTPSTCPVTFDKIQMREYCTVIGDNPSCTVGPPISIGWQFRQGLVISVDNYEKKRGIRRSCVQMAMPREVREDILMEDCGFTRSQIAAAVRENIKVKQRRRRTVNNLGKVSKLEEAAESFSRKLKRVVFCHRAREYEYLDGIWWEEYHRAAKAVAEEIAAAEEEHSALNREVTFKQEHETEKLITDFPTSDEESIQEETPEPLVLNQFSREMKIEQTSEADMGSEPKVHSSNVRRISAVESSGTLEGLLDKIGGVNAEKLYE